MIDFRADFLFGAESGCLSVIPVWICASDVLVTCIDLNKKEPPLDRPRDGSLRVAPAPSPSVDAQGSRTSREHEQGTAGEPDVLPEMNELGPASGGVGDRPVR